MKTAVNKSIRRTDGLARLCLLAMSFIASAAHAGLTFTVDIIRYSHGNSYRFYTPLDTNSIPPAAPFGMYFISSPQWPTNGSWRQIEVTSNGVDTLGGNENSYGDFSSLMQQLTNGTWSILFTNAITTNFYTFTVSAPTMTSNMLPATVITFPSDGALNVPNQPTFTWQGPTSWPVTGYAFIYGYYINNYGYSFSEYTDLPATQTSWSIPVPIPNGQNCTLTLPFQTNYITTVFAATTPLSTNTSPTTISGWTSATTLDTGDDVSFAVTNPPAAGISLVAHYTFDNSGNLGQDTSGHGYDLNYNGGSGVTSSGIAAAGSGAASFNGGSFFSYTSTPGNVLSTLAGDFTVSFWIKTSQNNGNENGPAYAGAGIFTADVPGAQYYDLVPAALDGGQIGFNTGHYDDTVNSTTDVNNGNYHHIAITRNQATGEKKIYVDGSLDNSQFATLNPLSDPRLVAIGCQIDASQSDPSTAGTADFFSGLLDDIQIYSGVLSDNDVAYLYANPGSNVLDTAGSDFNVALNTTNLPWTTGGDTSWLIETTNSWDGVSAAQSGSVTNNQSSTLSVTVTGPGYLDFYWSSFAKDPNGDFDYGFYIDNPNSGDLADLYGDQPWQSVQLSTGGPVYIPPGQHTLFWTVYAYGDTDPTQAGFLDQVSYVPDTMPVITLNPFSQTNYSGYPVWLSANATSNPTATWQWYKVGAGAIPGATTASFIPTNSGTAGVAGSYYAVAGNDAGSAITTTAAVSFVSAPVPPDWSRAVKSPFNAGFSTNIIRDYYAGCAVDAAGEVYVADQYVGNVNVQSNFTVLSTLTAAGNFGAAALVKHAADGRPIWAFGLTNNQSSSYSYGVCVSLAPGNGAYLASALFGTNWLGTNQFANNGGGSVLLSRFDANGSNVWSRLIGKTNQVYILYNNLVSDAAGNLTVAGVINGTADFGGTNLMATGYMGFLAQYNANGGLLWAQILPGIPQNLAYGAGRIYLALPAVNSGDTTNLNLGSLSNLTDRAYGLAAINATNGQALWLRGVGEQYGAKTNGGFPDDVPLVSVSGADVFVTGNAYGSTAWFGGLSVPLPGGRYQYFARYDTNGNAQVATNFGSATTMPWASAANSSGVYISGDFDSFAYFGNLLVAAPVYATNYLGTNYFTQPFLAKFDRNGNPLWARNGVSSIQANFRGIATATDGVWASGISLVANVNLPAQFGTNYVFSDDYLYYFGTGVIALFTQGGLLTKVTESSSSAATPVTLINPHAVGANFQFQFLSAAGFNHNILYRTNLAAGNWQTNSTVSGDGTVKTISLPFTLFSPAKQGFIRVSTQ
jgi:hypothetical protein